MHPFKLLFSNISKFQEQYKEIPQPFIQIYHFFLPFATFAVSFSLYIDIRYKYVFQSYAHVQLLHSYSAVIKFRKLSVDITFFISPCSSLVRCSIMSFVQQISCTFLQYRIQSRMTSCIQLSCLFVFFPLSMWCVTSSFPDQGPNPFPLSRCTHSKHGVSTAGCQGHPVMTS